LLARAKERATIKEIVRRTGYSRGRSNVKRLKRARPAGARVRAAYSAAFFISG
jgi:hypothetical protein